MQNPAVRKLGRMALKELPNIYGKISKKVKNKNLKKILDSNLANTLVNMGSQYGISKLS